MAFRARIVIDREGDLVAKADQRARIVVARMDQQRRLGCEVVQMAPRASGRVGERKQVLLEGLIAELAGEEQVLPDVGEPEIAELLEGLAGALANAALGAVVLDVAVRDVPDLAFAERALPPLSCDQGVLDRLRTIE